MSIQKKIVDKFFRAHNELSVKTLKKYKIKQHLKKITHFFGPSLPLQRPCTRNNEPRSAFSSMETFCKIL